MATEQHFVVGLDLGQRNDYSALVVVEVVPNTEPPRYVVRHIERTRGKSYSDVARWVKDRVSRPPLGPGILAQARGLVTRQPPTTAASVYIIVDETGVGAGVVEILEDAQLGHPLVPVTITAGLGETKHGQRWNVSKARLISTIDALIDNNRLTIGPKVPGRDVLFNELTNFRRKYSKAANEMFASWRESDHDDTVLACALALWGWNYGPCRPVGVWLLNGPSSLADRPIGYYSDEREQNLDGAHAYLESLRNQVAQDRR